MNAFDDYVYLYGLNVKEKQLVTCPIRRSVLLFCARLGGVYVNREFLQTTSAFAVTNPLERDRAHSLGKRRSAATEYNV